MKKVLLFITMAASLLFTQCKKEDSASSEAKPVKMTITVGQGGKTDITGNGGITWSENDKIYVGDGSKYIGYLTLADGVGTPTGTFTGSVGLTDADEGKELTFHFYYLGSADHTNLAKNAESVEVDFSSQDITKDGNGKLTNASLQHVCYGSAKGTVIGGAVTDINVMMVSKVAIAHFNFKKGDADYKGALKLSGTNICNKMTVNFNSEVFACTGTKGEISLTNTTSSEKYVMLVPTAETTVSQTLTFAGEYVSGEATLENGIKPNKFYGKDDAIPVTLESTKVPEFSVSGTKTVEFASGNLYYDGTTDNKWKFEANQWDFRTYNGKGSCIDGTYNKDNGTPTNDWGLFGWSTSASNNNWGMHTMTTNTTEYTGGDFKDWGGLAIGNDPANTWRTLSKAEWEYLLNTRANASSLRAWVTLDNNVSGLVILPDGSTTNASTVTTTALVGSSGAVFLPAAGRRFGSDVSFVGSYGDYWSSTPNGTDYAYYMGFRSSGVLSYSGNLYRGFAVRLVR